MVRDTAEAQSAGAVIGVVHKHEPVVLREPPRWGEVPVPRLGQRREVAAEHRVEQRAAFEQGAYRPQLALPMSSVQAGMLRARENQFERAYNTNVPVGGMKTDPRGAAYRRIARK